MISCEGEQRRTRALRLQRFKPPVCSPSGRDSVYVHDGALLDQCSKTNSYHENAQQAYLSSCHLNPGKAHQGQSEVANLHKHLHPSEY